VAASTAPQRKQIVHIPSENQNTGFYDFKARLQAVKTGAIKQV